MLNIIVEKIRAKQELNNQYGCQSCFDVPDAYNKMDRLALDISEKCAQVVHDNLDHNGFVKFLPETLLDVLNTVNDNVGNLEEKELMIYTQDEYIEHYVLGSLSADARGMFDNLFYYMNSDDRAGWLHSNHIDQDQYTYADKFVDFVIMVHG